MEKCSIKNEQKKQKGDSRKVTMLETVGVATKRRTLIINMRITQEGK